MRFFSKIFRSNEDKAIVKLRYELSSGRKVTLDYGIHAREVAAEKSKKGLFQDVEHEVISQMIQDWEERLENMIDRKIIDEINRLHKMDEFSKILDTDIDRDVYLTHVIPNYLAFLEKAVAEAKMRL